MSGFDETTEILNFLKYESLHWVEARDKSERAGGYDGSLNHNKAVIMQRIDHLLEELLRQDINIELVKEHAPES